VFIFKDIRCTEWQDSLLKSGNNTANIYAKKLHFIHTVNGDGSKTAKIIKSTINHTNIAWTSMLVWLVVPFCDFCGLKTYITYKVCRTVELYQAMSIHLAQQHSHCHAKHGVPRPWYEVQPKPRRGHVTISRYFSRDGISVCTTTNITGADVAFLWFCRRRITSRLSLSYSNEGVKTFFRDRDIWRTTSVNTRDEPIYYGLDQDKCLRLRHCQGTVIKTHYSYKTTTMRTIALQ